jgi:hypothetical protein
MIPPICTSNKHNTCVGVDNLAKSTVVNPVIQIEEAAIKNASMNRIPSLALNCM